MTEPLETVQPTRRHLITLDGMSATQITALLDRAADLRMQFRDGARALPLLTDRTVFNLFFEPSTRTRASFDLAARRLGAQVINFDIANSSTGKGESLEDTLATLEAMDADAFVVRHQTNGTPERLAAHARQAVVINAGDGNHAHPTQGLLDALTIRDRKGSIEGLKVTICGDIRHSRVARSDVHALRALGVGEIRLCGPRPFWPDDNELVDCEISDDFDAAITDVDVVIMLRIQIERIVSPQILDVVPNYSAHYRLDGARLSRAASDALVMHPGPMNRGLEIASEVADGPQSMILDQVANGVFVRMAVLADLLDA
ncbi:MAG: aspartate carbamoyltransferase catalytic subunit [Dokdonella sp.]